MTVGTQQDRPGQWMPIVHKRRSGLQKYQEMRPKDAKCHAKNKTGTQKDRPTAHKGAVRNRGSVSSAVGTALAPPRCLGLASEVEAKLWRERLWNIGLPAANLRMHFCNAALPHIRVVSECHNQENFLLCSLVWTCIHNVLRQGRFHCCPESQANLMDFAHFAQAFPKRPGGTVSRTTLNATWIEPSGDHRTTEPGELWIACCGDQRKRAGCPS